MKFKLLCVTLLCSLFALAQEDDLIYLKGKVIVQIKELEDINVLNSRSQSSTATSKNGDFLLFVKVGDTLKFSGLQVVSHQVVVSKIDVSKTLFVVNLIPKVIELSEVKITDYPNINAVSLGILEKPAKKYTPAERRVRTAGEFHWYYPLLIPFGGMPLDGLINSISGRTNQLKKEVEIEQKEARIKKLENYFGEDYFTETLKIPAAYVNGFLFYVVEDEKFIQTASDNNKSLMQFELGELAVKYLEVINGK